MSSATMRMIHSFPQKSVEKRVEINGPRIAKLLQTSSYTILHTPAA